MTEIECPRAKSFMTPCIARDGHLALSTPTRGRPPVCVGCGVDPRDELAALAERWPPARAFLRTTAPGKAADRLREQVANYVEAKA